MISINICRITPDREYLEFNVETLSNYKFTNVYLWEYTSDKVWVIDADTLNLNAYLDGINNREIKRIPLSEASLNGASLYYLQFTVEWNETGTEDPEAILYANAVVADLSQNYYTKVRLVTDVDNNGLSLDKLLNIYIYENCFKSAIALERWEDASYYYGLLSKVVSNNLITSL